MSSPHSELSPVSEATTQGVRVEVLSRFVPENSHPQQGEWVFQYTVRVTNLGQASVQLVSRHWIITDATEHVEEVRGPGVVGKQPVLEPGEAFEYSSWCPLKTPFGNMRGTYHMVRGENDEFDAAIAPFALKSRYTVH